MKTIILIACLLLVSGISEAKHLKKHIDPAQETKHKEKKEDSKSFNQMLKKVQDYLNGIKTLKGKFLEVSPEGEKTGSIYWKRPDKFKLVYDPAFHQLIVIRDGIFHHIDTNTHEHQNYGISNTPAALLLREGIDFKKNVKVLDAAMTDEAFSLTLADPDNDQGSSLTLVFQTTPYLLLRFWQVQSQENQQTTVFLSDLTIGTAIEENVFDLPK